MIKHPPYFILVSWLWLAGLMLFMVMITWDMGLLPEVLASDQTRISALLLLLTALITLHCAYRSYKLSRLEAELLAWQQTPSPQSLTESAVKGKDKPLPNPPLVKGGSLTSLRTKIAGKWLVSSLYKGRPGGVAFRSLRQPIAEHETLLSTYLPLMTRAGEKNLSLNGELLAEHFHYQHAFGWFAAGAMIKLGLLGTVIGFIMMLTSIGGLDSLEIEQVQQLMQRMTQGMMVALNTTLLGLVGSMILGVQYLFLDHCADRLLVRTMTWVQQVAQEKVG